MEKLSFQSFLCIQNIEIPSKKNSYGAENCFVFPSFLLVAVVVVDGKSDTFPFKPFGDNLTLMSIAFVFITFCLVI